MKAIGSCYTDYEVDGKPVDDHSTYYKVRRKQEGLCPGNDKKAGNRRGDKSSNEQDMYTKVHNKQKNFCTYNDKEVGSWSDENANNDTSSKQENSCPDEQSTYDRVRSKQGDSSSDGQDRSCP